MKKLIFGKVTLFQEACPKCGELSLSGDAVFFCDSCLINYNKIKKMTTEVRVKNEKRRLCPVHIRRILKIQQEGRCYWCDREFGANYMGYTSQRYWKLKKLKMHYDHKVSFAFLQNNPDTNWVIACNVCNSYKSNLMFKTEGECSIYLLGKWARMIDQDKIRIDY